MTTLAGNPAPERPTETAPAGLPEASLVPVAGWHVLHLFYRIDRAALARLSGPDRDRSRERFAQVLEPGDAPFPAQLQCFATVGHKADFGVLMAGPDLRVLHRVQMDVQSDVLAGLLVPAYSFYSITEVSEYVPDAEAYGRILRHREKMDPESSVYKTRVTQYAGRLEAMNRQRLYPEFPDWPCLCFYPMNKMRVGPEQNWYLTPFDERMEMMTEHGKSGQKFGGKVSQVITASTGLDDWEWGVTLWARNPVYLKEIVYTMRFDRASAQYAQFGPFYPGYRLSPAELAAEVRL
jgi:chlorite dismutase